uniref:Reverse transcriptase domain-containing protein n=1 Tax=Fagus sylvatica TaxID=28930 RepID=A0A2N9HHK0_FAGSY
MAKVESLWDTWWCGKELGIQPCCSSQQSHPTPAKVNLQEFPIKVAKSFEKNSRAYNSSYTRTPNTDYRLYSNAKKDKPPLGKIKINLDAAIGELQVCCAAVMATDSGLDKDAIAEDKDATGLECEMMEDADMSDRPKEKDRVRSSVNGDHLGHPSEDDDTSRRNNKKHKESHLISVPDKGHGSESPIGDVEPTSAPTSPIRARTGISYKDSLIGVIPGAYEHAFFGSSMEEDEILSFKMKKRMRNHRKMVKLSRLGVLPHKDLILQSGFEDVLKRGPWFIGEHFLSLRPWVPNFRASEASVKIVAIWVRLPELPVEYYHKDSLLHIGSGLGPGFESGTLIRQLLFQKCRVMMPRTSAAPDRADGFSAVQGHDNITKHVYEASIGAAGPSDVKRYDRKQNHANSAKRRVAGAGAGSAEDQRRAKSHPNFRYSHVDKGKSKQGSGPGQLYSHGPLETNPKPGQYIRIDEDVIELIRKDPLHVWGWYDAEIAQAWTEIAPAVQGEDPPLLTDMVWLQEISPFWNFLTDIPRIDGIYCPLRVRCQPLWELRFVQFLEEVYCATLPDFEERKVMLSTPIHFNWFTSTVIRNNIWEMWPERAWNSLEEEGTLFPPNNPPFMSSSEIGVNILTWNCRGVLNPCFRKALLDTLNINNPDILILTETRLGGDRAAELARSFPLDGFLCTNTIGFAGGIWILWKTEVVEVGHLCSTEQEIHASVKVRGSNSLWLISAIYASPRRSERRILWENLKIIAGLNNLPCVMLGDFNDILLCEEKWGVVEKAWATPALNLSITFSIFAALVSAWNKSKFDNIFHRKKRILARLNGVQCALTSRPSESLYRIEKSLREDYFVILKLEEELWALKSRVGWVVEGDRNTKFFHTSTIVRRRANKIVRLRNSVGEWITDNDLIRLHIQQGFVDLFSTSHLHPPSGFCLPMWAPRISDQEALSLTAHVDANDVKRSLWSLKAFKAPGPDGLHPGFSRNVGLQLVIRWLKSQFRPISLCNTVFKIVTKIIVSRLRPIIGNLVSPFQAAFVPGRRGLDNVVIAQELIHSIHRKKGRMGQLIPKLDLEKAYDRIEWDFIREVLTFFKFPPSFVDLVLECVSTSSFSILVNGGQLENFKPSRGIRQGDPLSPYLFILCMEYLSLKILEACDNNSWKAIKASRTGPSFSHLLPKSKVFFSPNVNPNLRQHLCGILGVSSTPNLGKYLGFPLRSNGRSTRDFDFVVEKVQAKLSSWKAKLLSPAEFVSNLDKLNRDFLWGSTDDRKKMHMLNWRVMENPNSLWAKTLIAKYCPNGIMDERLGTRRSGSSNWKGLKKGHEVFRKGLRWVVNNGQEISFWHDLWVGDRPLRSLVHGPLSPWEDSLRICDVVEGVSMWNLSTLSLDLPTCIRESIKAISVCPNRPLADKCVWDSVGGEFKLGKAYSIACLAGGGGIIRNHVGDWVGGFSRAIGITTSVQAELRALKDGLNLAIDLRILNLEIEMDSLVAVELVNSITIPNAFLSTIVTDCRSLLERFESCSLKHIFREANGCADFTCKNWLRPVTGFYFLF